MEVWIVWSWEDQEQLATPVAAFSSRSRAESFMAQQRAGHFRCRRMTLNPAAVPPMAELSGNRSFALNA